MIAIGIDHALHGPCGIAVIDNNDHAPVAVLHAQTLVYTGKDQHARAAQLLSVVAALIERYQPVVLACEASYIASDKPAAVLSLEHAAGLLHAVAIRYDLDFVRVSHFDTDDTKRRMPARWFTLIEIKPKLRIHAQDAIAIAWHGCGLAERAMRIKEAA